MPAVVSWILMALMCLLCLYLIYNVFIILVALGKDALAGIRDLKERIERRPALQQQKKANAEAYVDYLKENDVRWFYHFTDIRNLPSIIKRGGLYSWYYCVNNGITVPSPGGSELSRSLDMYHGLEDYVRLSFCSDHPMKFGLERNGAKLIQLKIKIDVAGLENAMFSDMNATSNRHLHGPELEDLKRVNLYATKQRYVRRDSLYFEEHQAEVMIKTFVPLKYIRIPWLKYLWMKCNRWRLLRLADSFVDG